MSESAAGTAEASLCVSVLRMMIAALDVMAMPSRGDEEQVGEVRRRTMGELREIRESLPPESVQLRVAADHLGRIIGAAGSINGHNAMTSSTLASAMPFICDACSPTIEAQTLVDIHAAVERIQRNHLVLSCVDEERLSGGKFVTSVSGGHGYNGVTSWTETVARPTRDESKVGSPVRELRTRLAEILRREFASDVPDAPRADSASTGADDGTETAAPPDPWSGRDARLEAEEARKETVRRRTEEALEGSRPYRRLKRIRSTAKFLTVVLACLSLGSCCAGLQSNSWTIGLALFSPFLLVGLGYWSITYLERREARVRRETRQRIDAELGESPGA